MRMRDLIRAVLKIAPFIASPLPSPKARVTMEEFLELP